jgi:uncharacterized glyoxalase superfamily protein PhnB
MIDVSDKLPAATVVPVLRYRDLPAAIAWLCKAFGFERQRVTVDRNGAITYAQLTCGSALIMVGPVRASAFDKLLKQPDEVGGAETQVCYFFVADAHAHCARAKAAGAEIVFDIEDRANGGRSYSCRDPEGHLWNFGTYDPWLRRALGNAPTPRPWSASARRLLLAAALSGCVAAIVMHADPVADRLPVRRASERMATGSITRQEEGPTSAAVAQPVAGDRAAQDLSERLAEAQRACEAVRKRASDTREQLAQATADREAAARQAHELRDRLARAWAEKTAAERAAREARLRLMRERAARAVAAEGTPAAQSRTPWQAP